MAAEKVDKFKLEFDRYLEVMEVEGYGDVNSERSELHT